MSRPLEDVCVHEGADAVVLVVSVSLLSDSSVLLVLDQDSLDVHLEELMLLLLSLFV